MICFHRWSKWEIAKAKFIRRLEIPDVIRNSYPNNGNEQYTAQVQIRRCEKCGKYQQAEI